MNADTVWPVVVFGSAVFWITVVAIGDVLYKRRQRDPDHCDCWMCTQARDHADREHQP